MSTRALCVHGHFYQPLRENPFSGVIPVEKGAEPFANYNEKVTAECYKPNAVLDNFSLLSFNFGPTLIGWLADHNELVYRRIVEADRCNTAHRGVGNALAQAYHHTILPLALRHDKETQIAWGIADFCHRFGRSPKGMWLPEMAVDYETLEVMAEQGIEFTILSPHQARQSIDPSRPYWVRLPAGRRMAVFFRHDDLSNRVAFDPYLTETTARFVGFLNDTTNGNDGLYLVATDGETFGHHQPGRERFVHDLLAQFALRGGCQVTYLARYLQDHLPTKDVDIWERTSWSCWHGIARWNESCSCTAGDGLWKRRLRRALDRLAWEIDAIYLAETRGRVAAPWQMRHDYIRVLLGEADPHFFVSCHSDGTLRSEEEARLIMLLEAQRHRQAMYTSCGWFFEDLSRIEPGLVIAYAARAIQLVQQAVGVSLGEGFRRDLKAARSSATDQTGADIYDDIVAEYW